MTVTAYKVTGILQWTNLLVASNFGQRLKGRLRAATKKNGALAQKLIRAEVMSAAFQKNANLTIAIKGSSTPLIDSGKMLAAVIRRELYAGMVFVGVPKSSTQFQVASIVHEGAVVPVTPSMRLMFMMLYAASQGRIDPSQLTGRAAELWSRNQTFYPIGDSTDVIIIPGRPFIEKVFRDPAFIAQCKQTWALAIQSAIRPNQRRRRK